ncbi:MAG: hypothetical protein Q8O30_00345 [Candidatus Omnitrophota bacterium]|nr:hypothetical protein [Candidatus Omnitrophota bacterium]
MSEIKTINPNREWDIIKFETFHNKPLMNGPHHKDVVNKRSLLLFAQCFLADYQTAKSKKYKDLFGELYRRTMKTYFTW